VCGENCVGLEWKEALIRVNWCNCNGLRSAINVSKCGHNVTGALLGCRFRDREVGGSNPLAPTNQFKHLRLPVKVAVLVLWQDCGDAHWSVRISALRARDTSRRRVQRHTQHVRLSNCSTVMFGALWENRRYTKFNVFRLFSWQRILSAWASHLSGMKRRLLKISQSTRFRSLRPRQFADPLSRTIPDPLHSEEEDRFVVLGQSGLQHTLVVEHTYRGEVIRIISARTATSL